MKVLECSSAGDKRFSSFYAQVTFNGVTRTIEEWYQNAKRDENGKVPGKGKPVDYFVWDEKVRPVAELTSLFQMLWDTYLDNNPDLVYYALEFDDYNDKFKGKSINCQADAIRNYIQKVRKASELRTINANKKKEGKTMDSKNCLTDGLMVYSNTYLLARYFMKDEKIEDIDVQFYVDKIKDAMVVINKTKNNTLDLIYDAMITIKSLGIKQISESSNFYVDYDEKFHKFTPRFKIEDGFFELFKMKYRMLYMDYSSFDREKLIEMLKFFRYINDGVETVDDAMIESALNLKDLYKHLKPAKITKESNYNFDNELLTKIVSGQKSMLESFVELADNKAGIKVELLEFYENKYRNTLQKVKLTLSGKKGDADFELYIPLKIDGVYHLGRNEFIQTNLVEDYIDSKPTNKLKKFVNMVIKSSLNITKAYYINEGNHLIIQHSLQTALNGLFFAKRTLTPSKDDIDFAEETSVKEFDEKEYIKNNSYEFSPFVCISNQSDSLTMFEKDIEHYKLYYKEYNVQVEKSLMDTIGKKGFGKYHHFLLTNKYLKLFDPAFVNSKANFTLAWTNKQKHSLMEMNPFYMFNKKSIRNALGPYVIGHAFELAYHKPEKPITTNYLSKHTIPSYNMWFLFSDFEDSKGLSTYDGQRLLTKYQYIARSLYECLKLAFNGLDKGISRMTDDEVYFMHNGEKIYLNITSPLNVASRENLGVLIEGLYNAQSYFNGIVTHKRDFEKQALIDQGDNNLFNELFPLQEVFVNGKSIGKHVVGLMTSYFVHDVESTYKNEDLEEIAGGLKPTFKKYTLSSEWFKRLALMGDTRITNYLLGTPEEIEEKVNVLLEENKGKLFTKKGSIVKRAFQREVIGYSSTASANASLRDDEARLYLPEQEIDIFLKAIHKIEKNFDIEKARRILDNGGFVSLPPALQLRNPSIDDANTIYMNTFLYKTTSVYAKYGYIEVSPKIWAIQGGDFDGDQVILLFFPFHLKKNLRELFKVTHHQDLIKIEYENKIKQLSNLTYPEALVWQAAQYKDLKTFLNFIALVKEKTPMEIEQLSRRECIVTATSNNLTTRISKQLIGVSKVVTMKGIFYIEDAIRFYGLQNDLDLMKRVRTAADSMNRTLVQDTINIQKWSDDLNKVVRLVETVMLMSEAVSYGIESHFYSPKYEYWKTIEILEKIGYIRNTGKVYEAIKDLETPIESTKIPKHLVEFLNKADLSTFINNTGVVEKYDIRNAGWSEKENPKEFILSLIEVISTDGDLYKTVVNSVEEKMEDFDANEKFYVIKGGEE